MMCEVKEVEKQEVRCREVKNRDKKMEKRRLATKKRDALYAKLSFIL